MYSSAARICSTDTRPKPGIGDARYLPHKCSTASMEASKGIMRLISYATALRCKANWTRKSVETSAEGGSSR
eukprot:2701240-Amphidinium_carterae.1